MDLPLMIYENTMFLKLCRALINCSNMQSGFVTTSLEVSKVSHQIQPPQYIG